MLKIKLNIEPPALILSQVLGMYTSTSNRTENKNCYNRKKKYLNRCLLI